jgi:hypothetical protein
MDVCFCGNVFTELVLSKGIRHNIKPKSPSGEVLEIGSRYTQEGGVGAAVVMII